MKNMGSYGFSYGWVVVALSFCILAVSTGAILTFGVFLKPLLDAFGWTRAEVSLAYSLNWIIFGLCSPIWGALSDRFSTRRVVLLGGIIYGGGMLLTSQVRSLWELYLFFGVLTGVGMSAFYAPLTAMVVRWFTQRKGLAIGLISAGTGVGTFVLPPAVRYLITTSGWQSTFFLLGLVSLVVILPASLLLRDHPPAIAPGGNRGLSQVAPNTLRTEILGTPSFWGLLSVNFLCCTSHSIPLLHVVAYATDLGIPQMAAASILAVAGASSIGGRIGIGAIADRLGGKRVLIGSLALQGIMIFCLLGARGLWMFYLFAIFFGVAYGGGMPLYAVLTREYFGEVGMATIYGGILLGATLGMALGGFLGGWIFDASGSYVLAYLVSSLIGLLAVLLAGLLRAPGCQLQASREVA